MQSQDDACALFGGNRVIAVSNSTFSTRWSVFRFGGGNPQDVTVSNCIIYETYDGPLLMPLRPETPVDTLSFPTWC